MSVRLALTGSPEGQTELSVNRRWGGASRGGDDIFDFAVRDGRGRRKEVAHPEPHRWLVHHAPRESLLVSYRFAPNDHQVDSSPSGHRLPILNDSLFHIFGELGVVVPEHLDSEEPRRIELAWNGFTEAGWSVACSFGVGAERRVIDASLNDFRHAIFMAGALEILRRDVEGRPLYIAIQSRDWNFTKRAFADLASSIVAFERAFFDDYDYPFFLITLIPVGGSGPGSSSLGGTGLTNSFALMVSPETGLQCDFAESKGVKGLLAHEMFHTWNGRVIKRQEPEELVYWFSEGFTDFYTRRLLYRAALIDVGEYVGSLNKALADLYTSPELNAPNERILTHQSSNHDVERLPYRRGDVVALLVDHAIRVASGGTQSLDDLMRGLVHDARERGHRISTESLLERIELATDPDTATRIRRIVDEGETPLLDRRIFEPCLGMRVEPVARFEIGFDFERSREERIIVGVVPHSRAAAAGVRDGQELLSWSVRRGDTRREVVLKVRDGDRERDVSYLPVGTSDPAPRFFTGDGSTKLDCTIL
ncbi:MAG: hypothetical protein JSW67_05435 [Candidatus Latescibacterota bacterium]|nr:MAG: hypothetical protein JSW67_05435 [Candidatus Latescibacterota bacterium]